MDVYQTDATIHRQQAVCDCSGWTPRLSSGEVAGGDYYPIVGVS